MTPLSFFQTSKHRHAVGWAWGPEEEDILNRVTLQRAFLPVLKTIGGAVRILDVVENVLN